ncbi:hypothetical protein Emed_003819 [Eimeria media]
MDSPLYLPLPADLQINLHNEVVSNRLHSSGGLSASPYAVKVEGYRHEHDQWSTLSPHKTQLKSLIAAFTSITAITFLILVCRSVRSRAQWLITRKLSSDEDDSDSDSDGLIICEDPGEEEPGDSAQQSPHVLLTPPKAKKPKVEAGESGAHSSVEEESKPESGSDDDEPSTSAGQKRKRKAQAPSRETPSGEGPESTARSDEELEAASALLDLHQSLVASGEAPPEAEGSPVASPPSAAPLHGPTTSAGKAQVLAPLLMQPLLQPITILLPFGPALVPTQVVAPTPGAALVVEGTGDSVASTSSPPLQGEEGPSTSSAATETAVSPQGPVHPFYQIPRVDPEHKGVRRFRPELTTQQGLAFRSLSRQLKRMRGLLGKETLTPLELEELAQETAETLAFVFNYEGDSTRGESPSLATHELGRRFLLLDAAIAGLQVLEEPACGEWWNRVVNIIPDDTPEDPAAYKPLVSVPGASFNMDLEEIMSFFGAQRTRCMICSPRDWLNVYINLHNGVVFNHLYSSGILSASPHAVKGEGHPREIDQWSTRSPHRTHLKSLIAAFASLTAIIFLILICRSVRSRAHSVISTRKLSSDGDDSEAESDRLVICEDSDVEDLEDAAQQSPEVPLSPPKAKKAKVEAGGEMVGAPISVEEKSESESDDDQPSTSAGKKRKRKAPAPSPETPSDEGTVSPERRDEELEAASALIDLQQSLAIGGEIPLEDSSAALPPSAAPVHGPTTSAAASQMLVPIVVQHPLQPITILVPFGSTLVPTHVALPTPGAALVVEGTGDSVVSTSPVTSSGGEEPSTSSAAGGSAVPPRPRVHPYYRVPEVNPLHRGVRLFKRELATEYGIAFRNFSAQLKRMRGLLLKERLSPRDLGELAQATLELLAYVYHYERQPTRNKRPSRATHDLGRRFMFLDSAVAALQVLDEPACGEWWDRIMDVIPDDTPEDPSVYKALRRGAGARFHMDLMKRLHAALRTLKSGNRLSEKETIALKRDLFCSPHSPDNFKTPVWDVWRDDDKNFPGTS